MVKKKPESVLGDGAAWESVQSNDIASWFDELSSDAQGADTALIIRALELQTRVQFRIADEQRRQRVAHVTEYQQMMLKLQMAIMTGLSNLVTKPLRRSNERVRADDELAKTFGKLIDRAAEFLGEDT